MKKKFKGLKEFRTILRYFKEDRLKLIMASVFLLICSTLEIFSGYLNGAAIDSISKVNLKGALYFFIIYFVLRLVIDGFSQLISRASLQKIEYKISTEIGYETYKKALNLPAYAYEKSSSGEIINRINSDSFALTSTFERLIEIISSLLGSFILAFYIFFNSWIIGLEIAAFVVLLSLIIKKYDKVITKVKKNKRKNNDEFTSLVNESVRGIREIKTLGIKHNLLTDMKSICKRLLNKSYKNIEITTKYYTIINILKIILEIGVFMTCAVLLYYRQITLTFFIAMTYYVYRYMWLIENIKWYTEVYENVTISLGRINEILDNRLYKEEKFGNQILEKVTGLIEFKNVSFSYPKEDMILSDFNLILEPNKKIAIVGKSGQGKSTLFNLLTRIFDYNKGKILIDGVEIKNLSEECLRKEISIIRQEPFIFNRTIFENFKLIDKNITLRKVRKYTKMAYLDDYIMSLPKKYDTILGEGGVNLSGGQKQRLSIARTLCKESKIILFDEATSALDNESQDFIKKAIDNLVSNHTVIIVAHRLSTIIDADTIYVVDNGKIVGSGTHKELLKNNKTYKKLYETEL